MLATATVVSKPAAIAAVAATASAPVGESSRGVGEILKVLGDKLQPQRRLVHAGDVIYRTDEAFANLHVLNTGFVKLTKLAADGREQVVGLKFRGDWVGFDGIASGRYGCEATAMDTGELWTIRYESLLAACVESPQVMTIFHSAMSRELGRDRDSLMSVCTLPAHARVAEFLRSLAESMSRCGLRSDQIALRLTRAEIGNYLGMTLESVSRALSRMARENVIEFAEGGRRDVRIPDLCALTTFVQRSVGSTASMH